MNLNKVSFFLKYLIQKLISDYFYYNYKNLFIIQFIKANMNTSFFYRSGSYLSLCRFVEDMILSLPGNHKAGLLSSGGA